jgi:argininosuccinate lyase
MAGAMEFFRRAQDFYVMTTFEFQTLQLPDSVAITLSIMPRAGSRCFRNAA